jgi:hypothetical protein
MSVKWIDRVLEHSRASGTPLLMMVVLADFADDAGECWPSISTVTKKCRLKDERHARRVIHDELERKLGEVEVIREGGKSSRKGGLRSNLYRLTVHMPEEEVGGLTGVPQPGSSETDGGLSPHDGGLSHHPTRVEGPPEPSVNRHIEPSENRATPEADFNEVWSIYPKRVDRGRALTAYVARRKEGDSTREDLYAATRNYAAATRGTNPRFVKHAANFFGTDRPYADFIEGIPAGMGTRVQSQSMDTVDRVLASVGDGRGELGR